MTPQQRMREKYRARNRVHIERTGTKQCSYCKHVLPRTDFYKCITHKDGLAHGCIECTNRKQREWKAKNPESRKRTRKRARARATARNAVVNFDGEKICNGCATIKPKAEFHINRSEYDGLQARCKECTRAGGKRGLRWKSHLKKMYGLGVEDYYRMLDAQAGLCAICSKEDRWGRKLSVDHCHKTGTVRALLCSSCNTILGHVNEDQQVLMSAILYLRWHEHNKERSS